MYNKEAAKRYREAHKDKIRDINRLWWKKNPNKSRQYRHQYYATDTYKNYFERTKKARHEWQKQYNAKFPKVRLMASKKWRDLHLDKYAGWANDRRAKILSVFVEEIDRQEVYSLWEGDCALCLKPVDPNNFHVDHRIPVSRGGLHCYLNTQLAHPSCNDKKRDRPMR